MSREYRSKVFKSGNSVAIRLPKALGIAEGQEFRLVRDDDGRILAHPVDDGMSLASLFGSFSADFMRDGRADAAESERDWGVDAADRSAA